MGVRDLPNVPVGFLFVRPEELAGMRRDPEWCADVAKQVAPMMAPDFGPFAAAFAEELLRASPVPDADGKWWPKITIEERDGKTFARLTWEARK